MFNNVGEKIKGVAVIWFVLSLIASVILGLATAESGGILFLLIGVVVSWVTALFLYGFGELIESTAENKRINRRILASLTGENLDDVKKTLAKETAEEDIPADEELPQRECPECGFKHDFDYPKCPACGHKYKYSK